jgi:hypothetical protein
LTWHVLALGIDLEADGIPHCLRVPAYGAKISNVPAANTLKACQNGPRRTWHRVACASVASEVEFLGVLSHTLQKRI